MRKLLPAAAVLLLGCSPLKISTDFDQNASFESYQTYALAEEVGDLNLEEPYRQFLIDAVVGQLRNKGLVEAEQSDIIVNIHVKMNPKEVAYSRGGALGRYGNLPYGFTSTSLEPHTYIEGTMFVDLMDRKLEEMLWIGRAEKLFDPEKVSQKAVEKTVNKLFKKYPPD